MGDNIVRGTVTNTTTGETRDREHYLLSTGFQVTTIIKVTQVESFFFEENQTFQVSVDGLGLSSIGAVFTLNLDYTPATLQARDRLLKDFQIGSLYLVKGEYSLIQGDKNPCSIILYEPDYRPVIPDFSEEEINLAFQVNSKSFLESGKDNSHVQV
jgi:hypothetical protein